MIKRKGLNHIKFHMEVSSHIKDKDWTGSHDKWLEFDVCMIDNDKWEGLISSSDEEGRRNAEYYSINEKGIIKDNSLVY